MSSITYAGKYRIHRSKDIDTLRDNGNNIKTLVLKIREGDLGSAQVRKFPARSLDYDRKSGILVLKILNTILYFDQNLIQVFNPNFPIENSPLTGGEGLS